MGNNAASRLLPKVISVGAEWAAGTTGAISAAALVAGAPGVGLLFLGCYAAFLAAKNSAQSQSGADAQAGVETLLASLLVEHQTLRKALDALAVEQHMHELVSRERLDELRALIQLPAEEIDKRLGEDQEIAFTLIRFLEEWRTQAETSFEQIEIALRTLPRLERKIEEGFDRIEEGETVKRAQLDRIEGILGAIAGTPSNFGPAPLGPEAIETLGRQLREASLPLMSWATTTGAGRHHITSAAEQAVAASLRSEISSSNLVLGPKGTGKSALSASICVEAVRLGFIVLAIKADRIPAEVESDDALRRFLNLPVRPAQALRLLASRGRVLLTVDQLDSVSELVDRSSARLNLLLNLMREVSGMPNLHLLAACREFDFQHDARLNTIVANEVRLPPAKWEQVAPVLSAEGHDPDRMAEPMRELLCIPWNLNMFLQVARLGEVFGSMQSLIEAVWQKHVTDSEGPTGRIDLLEAMALKMSDREELVVPVALADQLPAAKDALLRDEMIVVESGGRALTFRHQTYYDYTLARLFARGTKPLVEHVLAHQDGLFVRPTMLNGLELLRDSSPQDYHSQISAIFNAPPRYHIRTLLIEFLAQQKSPDDFEIQLLLPLALGTDGSLIMRAAAGSLGWFNALRASGAVADWMSRPPEEAAFCLGLLVATQRLHNEAVFELVRDFWGPRAECDRLIETIAYTVPNWTDEWVKLVSTSGSRSPISMISLAARIVESNADAAMRLVRAQLDRERDEAANAASAQTDTSDSSEQDLAALIRRADPFENVIGSQDHNRSGLEEIAKAAPREFLLSVWPWFTDALNRVAARSGRMNHEGLYRDEHATWMAYDLHVIPLLKAVHVAADGWAAHDPSGFSGFALNAANSDLTAVHRVLTQSLAIAAETTPDFALSYLLADRRRLAVGTHRNEQRFSEKLLAAVFPRLDSGDRLKLEQVLIDFEAFPRALYEDRPAEDRFRFSIWNRERRLRLLKALPEKFLSPQTVELKRQEETRFPALRQQDHGLGGLYLIGARMTAEEIAKATDEDVFNLFDRLGERHPDRAYRSDLPPGRSGGVRELAGELGKLAETQPERVLRILLSLKREKDDHQQYTAAAVGGLARSTMPAADFFEVVADLDRRGFASDDFRDAAASAIGQRVRRKEFPPEHLITRLEEWLGTMEAPKWPSDLGDVETTKHRGSIVFGHSVMFSLTHGRGSVFRAIAAVFGEQEPADAVRLINVARSRVRVEQHPKVLAEMLMSLHNAFTVNAAIKDATGVFDDSFHGHPEVMYERPTLFSLADLTGFFQPAASYERWLDLLAEQQGELPKQAFGELVMLYYARRSSNWADRRISAALASGDRSVITGLCYGGVECFRHSHCRRRGTDVLVAGIELGDAEIAKIVGSALIPEHDGTFAFDQDAIRLVESVCDSLTAVSVVGAQLLESLTPSAGVRPAIVLSAAKAVLAASGAGTVQLGHSFNNAAASLTTIAITLHRQLGYRADGLDLFEELQRRGIPEATAALNLLDRRPDQQALPPMFRRAPRRRPKPPSEH